MRETDSIRRGAELAGGPHEASGMLLYARTDEGIQLDGMWQMGSNRISVRTFDPGMPFDDIRKRLVGIAEAHFQKEA